MNSAKPVIHGGLCVFCTTEFSLLPFTADKQHRTKHEKWCRVHRKRNDKNQPPRSQFPDGERGESQIQNPIADHSCPHRPHFTFGQQHSDARANEFHNVEKCAEQPKSNECNHHTPCGHFRSQPSNNRSGEIGGEISHSVMSPQVLCNAEYTGNASVAYASGNRTFIISSYLNTPLDRCPGSIKTVSNPSAPMHPKKQKPSLPQGFLKVERT
jgi:hypothetical protein